MPNDTIKISDCPDAKSLQDWLMSGHSDDSKLIAHVEHCQRCQSLLDSITERPSNDATDENHKVASVALQRVIAKAKSHGAQKSSNPLILPGGWTPFPGAPTSRAPLGTLERYDVLRRIGEGSSGVLYEAFDRELERTVAIKVLRRYSNQAPDAHERLVREARAIASLRHPSIVTVYEVIQRDDFPPCLVMDYLPGGSLTDHLNRAGILVPKVAAKYLIQAADGIHAAHNHGLIHRDLKPSNLLIDELDQIRVADFGLVRDQSSDSDLTLTSDLTGTPAYMSPEQVRDPSGVDSRSDVYSLGAVLYQLLTGHAPFQGSVRYVLWQIENELPRAPREFNDAIPLELQNICLTALAKRPTDRYASAKDMSQDLTRFLAGNAVVARPTTARQKIASSWKKHPAFWSWTAAGIVTLFVVTCVSAVAAFQLKAARDAERIQALREKTGRDMAISAIDSMAIDVYDNLDDSMVDLDALQIDILTQAMDALQRIESEGGDVGTRYAAALLRLGKTHWRLGEFEISRDHLEKARVELQQTPIKQDDAESQLMKLQVDAALARLDYDQEDYQRAERNLKSVSRRAISFLRQHPDDEHALGVAFESTTDFAYAIESGVSPEDAVAQYQRAFELHSQFGTIQDLDAGRQHERLTLISDYADLLYTIDYRSETLAAYQELLSTALKIQESVHDAVDGNIADVGPYVHEAYEGLGMAYEDLEQFSMAAVQYQKALRLAEALTVADPGDGASHDTLMMTLSLAANCAESATQHDDQIKYGFQIVAEADRWRALKPDDRDRLRNALRSRKQLRATLRDRSDPREKILTEQIDELQSMLKMRAED